MPSTTPYITLNSLLNFNESSSGDVDTFTAYTDFLGQPSRALWVLNQLGTNTWTGHIESGGAGDSSDVIPFSIPTGYALSGYSITISNVLINSGSVFDLESMYGNTVIESRALTASFSNSNIAPAGPYSLVLGGGTNVFDYVLSLTIIKVNEAPTVINYANDPIFYSAGAAVVLFSNVQVSTVEAGQNINNFSLSVDGVADGSREILTLGGVAVHLASGQTGSLGNGVSYSVTDNNGSALVSLTMSSGILPAAMQALLETMTYENTSTQPTLGDRYVNLVSISDDGGTANTGVDTADLYDYVTVTVAAPANAAPVVISTGGTTAFSEGNNVTSTPVAIDNSLTLNDSDNATLAKATVSVTGNFHSGEDQLLFSNNNPSTMGNISASYSSSTGVLELTSNGATATLAQWQAALRSVTYTNSSDAPNTNNRTISFVVNDGTSESATGTKVVTVGSVNDTPIVQSSNGVTSFVEGSGKVSIDSSLTLTDLDSPTLASAEVSISGGFVASEDELVFANDSSTMGNIVASYDAAGSMTLTSPGATATLAQWQAALASVSYNNNSTTPDVQARTISFSINDGTENSAVATKAVSIGQVNDAPVITTLSSVATTFIEDGGAVVINAGLIVTDADNTTMTGAKVAIADFHAGQDLLTFVSNNASMGDISATYDASTGVLTLTSATAATLAQWHAALSSVKYENTSQAPTGAHRTINFSVNDSTIDSQAFTQTVTLTQSNDTPVITLASATQNIQKDAALTFNAANHNQISISDVDAGTSDVKVTLTATHGLLSLSGVSGLTILGGTGTDEASITVTGNLTDINAALNDLKFTPASGYTGSATVKVLVDDQGNSGGAPLNADKTLGITVSAIPTTPVTPVTPPVLVDGVETSTTPTTLPNGEAGSSVTVGLVTDSRQDDTGIANTADINLVGSGPSAPLSAKLPVGYGLTALGGAVKTAGSSGETLKAAIDAVTASTDEAHQNVNGQNFLDKLSAYAALLVQTITPVTSTTAPTQALQLIGSASSTQQTALVIDTRQMDSKGSLELNNVNFSAIVGQAQVQGNTVGQVLTGDDASQSFIVNASNSFVFAGGGSDTLQITSFAAANKTTLQGGQDNDIVQFSGDRSLYNIEQHGGFTIVSSKDDPSQQVKVINVESLSFADGAVSILTDTTQATLAALYQSVLGRQADVAGFDYWTQQAMSIGQVALSIFNSTEAGATAFNGEASHDIAALYTAFFGRTADAAGQAYWTQQVQEGHLTFDQVADSLLTSLEMTGHNKAPATWDFTV
ncbi:DUF4214 domain-containing protein [Pseudomonas baetica]|uniref:beta strand repeat-containing protein n=1 Tax=Pseudomonas baetica TaxID=674054 RepID=UPI001C8B9DD2|nr:DUF4214 domain-containing protein [Pseudomonas baetica]MBX9409688.1 DUF4214 domain-containing protein [Pseudomonas baetica]